MANLFTPQQLGKIDGVALPPIADSYYSNFTLEPQMVRIRGQNSAYIYLNSTDVVPKQLHDNNVVISAPGNGVIATKVKRMGLNFMRFEHHTKTINPTNRRLMVYVSSTNTVEIVDLPIGNYTSPWALMEDCLLATLNIVIPAVTWSIIHTDDDSIWELRTNVPVYFLWDCPAVKYGLSTFGWQIMPGPEFDPLLPPSLLAGYAQLCFTYTEVGPMSCCYTRYVDFHSFALTKWTKNPNTSTGQGPNSLVFRLYLPRFTSYATKPEYVGPPVVRPYVPQQWESFSDIANPILFTMNPTESITTIDLQIKDEYGRLFYLPESSYYNGSHPHQNTDNIMWNNGLKYDIAFYTEI